MDGICVRSHRRLTRGPRIEPEVVGENEEFIAEFLEECDENLDQLDQDLVALEDDPRDPERLGSIFRTIHTIKGSSGFFGFVKLGALTHDGENLLGKIRDGELRFDQSIASALLKMVDAIREIMSRIEQDGREGDKDYPDVLEELQHLATQSPALAEQAPPSAPEIATEAGTPPSDTEPADTEPADTEPADTEPADIQSHDAQARDTKPPVAEPADRPPAPSSPAPEPKSPPPKPTADATSIRVDVGLLDELMDFAGELVLARNALFQCSGSIESPELTGVTNRVSQITSEIQQRVMRTRMQPIGAIWGKFRRIVRDLSVSCGKEVRLELEGEETELDRSLLEAIRDPLTHIVRNAIDHGIEPPETRLAAGKDREGVLQLRARHESGQVVVEAIDDGGGMAVDTIREKVVSKGLLSEREAATASNSQILQYVFAPGFSTAHQVSEISGRGVGMDVVKSHIERIGGSVELQSTPGLGTTLTIRIPLTLAIIPALMVGAGGQRFVIPQASVLEVITAGTLTPIERVHQVPVYRLRDRLLPLVWLDDLLQLKHAGDRRAASVSEAESAGGASVVVLQIDGQRFGLVIDEVLNTLEIVVKPIGSLIKSIGAYSAATILGDGSVAMILDVSGICRLARLSGQRPDHAVAQRLGPSPATQLDSPHQPVVTPQASAGESMLLCEVGGGREVAIPLDLVERLEEIPLANIRQSELGTAADYRGTILPLVILGDDLTAGGTSTPGQQRAPDQQPMETVPIVVHRCKDQLIGAAVRRIVDVVQGDTVVDISGRQRTVAGVVGMTLAGGRMLEVVDLRRIAEARPE